MTAKAFTPDTQWEVRDWEGQTRVAATNATPFMVIHLAISTRDATGETLTIWADGDLVANLSHRTFECHRDHEALFLETSTTYGTPALVR